MARRKKKPRLNASDLFLFAAVVAVFCLLSGIVGFVSNNPGIFVIALIVVIVLAVARIRAKHRREEYRERISRINTIYSEYITAHDEMDASIDIPSVLKSYEKALYNLKLLDGVSAEELQSTGIQSRLTRENVSQFEAKKDLIVNQAINRAYTDMLAKAYTLKTEKGRANRISAFHDNIAAVSGLSASNLAYIDKLCGNGNNTMRITTAKS